MVMNNNGNKGVKTAWGDVKENKTGDLSQLSTINHSPYKTRVGNHQLSNMQQALLPIKHSKGTLNQAEFIGGTNVEVLAKNKPKRIVTFIATDQVYAGSKDVSKDILGMVNVIMFIWR